MFKIFINKIIQKGRITISYGFVLNVSIYLVFGYKHCVNATVSHLEYSSYDDSAS